MAQTLSTDDLPAPLGSVMRPWISIIETSPMGMGAEVMAAAANASLSLKQRIVLTPELDSAIAKARLASDDLGISLDKRGGVAVTARAAALRALETLIAGLREAQPNELAKRLGLGW